MTNNGNMYGPDFTFLGSEEKFLYLVVMPTHIGCMCHLVIPFS